VTGKGIPALVHRIADLLEQLPATFEARPEPAKATELAASSIAPSSSSMDG
jgi:hypothetical protein